MQTNKMRTSVKWKFIFAYFIIIVAMLVMTAFITTRVIEDTLLYQEVTKGVNEIFDYSLDIADDLKNKDAQALYTSALQAGKDYNCRVLIVNEGGIVIADSYSLLNGTRIDTKEVREVVTGVSDTSFGYHKIDKEEGEQWAVYYVSSVLDGSDRLGAALFSRSLASITAATTKVTQQLAIFFILSILLVGALSYFLTSQITRPLDDLKDAAEIVSEGDYSVRVKPSGSKEMSELINTFNRMIDRIENVDKQRSEFISNASHELKTPITSMKILAESLLANDDVPAEIYRDFLKDINSEMDRLNNLVKDLLLLTKLENAEATLAFEHADITEMCGRIVRMLTPLAESKHIDLSLEYSEYVEAFCSRSTIYEAINNLVENALKYTQDGGKVVVRPYYYKGKYVEVAVADTGEGISEENQKHLFERFYRVDKARSRATGGTGLGLHIVFQIAKAHGGKVYVKSKLGVGSTFYLRFLKDKEGEN